MGRGRGDCLHIHLNLPVQNVINLIGRGVPDVHILQCLNGCMKLETGNTTLPFGTVKLLVQLSPVPIYAKSSKLDIYLHFFKD